MMEGRWLDDIDDLQASKLPKRGGGIQGIGIQVSSIEDSGIQGIGRNIAPDV